MRWKKITLGASMFCWLAGGAGALPLLSEVYYDAPGADDGQLFVEISGRPGETLDDYVLEGINGANGAAGPTLVLSGSIGADGLFVVADADSTGTSAVPLPDLLADFDWQNGPDSIVLRHLDVVVDAIGYGVFDAGEVFAGEGAPAPDVAAGSSLARRFANVDSDDNLADFVESSPPTPGWAEFAPVPEPASALMLGLGLAGLGGAGTRHEHTGSPTMRRSGTRSRRNRRWRRRSTGTTSARVERAAPEHPRGWMPERS